MAHWKKRETLFSEYEVGLKMPGAWQLRPKTDPERWLYRSADHKEHLTLTRSPMEGRPGEEYDVLRQAATRNRRALELGFARVSNLRISETESGERVGVPANWYFGTANGAEHQFWTLFLCSTDAVWTFFYEAFKITEENAREHALWMLDSIEFRKSR